jgi:two-component system, LytTR family, sensor kinase
MWLTISKNKYLEVGVHLLFWLTYYFYPIIKFSDQHQFNFNFGIGFINVLLLIISIYPVYFSTNRKNKSWLWPFVIAMFFLFLFYNCAFLATNCNCNVRICYLNKGIEFMFIHMFFLGINSFKNNLTNQQALLKSEQERTKVELDSLKAQINPHFLFNTLNMLYSSSLNKEIDLSDKILMLSDNLHYVLHEGKKSLVSLDQEVAFIRDYMALFELRFKNKMDISLDFVADNPKKEIPPLLLIPFVENALKYTSMTDGKLLPIVIAIKLENDVLFFTSKNTFDIERSTKTDSFKESGIGIKNVERRLKLLFADRYELHVLPEGNIFNVSLKINLA